MRAKPPCGVGGCLRDLLALVLAFVLLTVAGTLMLALCEWAVHGWYQPLY